MRYIFKYAYWRVFVMSADYHRAMSKQVHSCHVLCYMYNEGKSKVVTILGCRISLLTLNLVYRLCKNELAIINILRVTD